MTFGDILDTFGKSYAIVVAAVTTVICLMVIRVALQDKPYIIIAGKEIKIDRAMAISGALLIAFMWFIVWLTQKYRLFSQVEGVFGGVGILRPLFVM